MWKTIRTILAVFCLFGFVLLFCDQSENSTLAGALAWLAKIQLVPAMLSGSFFVVLSLIIMTLFFGRVYCSILCPLGLLQDALACFFGKQHQAYRPGMSMLRIISLFIFIVSLIAGISFVYGLLEPYSAFGRIATDIGGPVAVLANNGMEWLTRSTGINIMPSPVHGNGTVALLSAVTTLLILVVLVRVGGRTWCNTICPVGSFLGMLSRFSLVRPRIDNTKCTNCGQCANHCKASCLDTKNAKADASRCVACFNCKDVCKFGALSFGSNAGEKSDDSGRRSAIASLLVGIAGIFIPGKAQADGDESGKMEIKYKEKRLHKLPVLPPGSLGSTHFSSRCTGCQLCVSACPNSVLASHDNGGNMLQAAMRFEHGFCRTNCTKCGEVCPTGAIRQITKEEKSAIQIGRAVINPDTCVTITDNVPCTACQRSCPAGCISLVGDGEIKRPAIDAEKCTGCGACEFHCPTRPVASIQVEANLEHRKI